MRRCPNRIDTRHFRIAGHLVRISFAGSSPAGPLTDAFQHLQADAGEPELEIRVFDSGSTGQALPLDAATLERLITSAMPSAQATGGLHAAYRRPDSGLSFLDASASSAWYWLPSVNDLPGWERGGPFRGILSWWMPSRGKRFVHAAAVGQDGRGVLVAGPGGSGKSTTALTCVADGMDYAGDDYCLVSPANLRVYSLYRSAKVHAHNLQRVQRLGPAVNTLLPGDEKGVYFPNLAQTPFTALDLAAIILPTVTNATAPRLRPAGRAAALAAVAPSTLLQLSAADSNTLGDLAKLCADLPAYTLELGERMDLVPDLLRGLL